MHSQIPRKKKRVSGSDYQPSSAGDTEPETEQEDEDEELQEVVRKLFKDSLKKFKSLYVLFKPPKKLFKEFGDRKMG